MRFSVLYLGRMRRKPLCGVRVLDGVRRVPRTPRTWWRDPVYQAGYAYAAGYPD